MIRLNGHTITPTIFPDKTSQVWKLDDAWFLPDINIITWEFEHEGEIMHIAQLRYLLYAVAAQSKVVLDILYLPYARQDKEISNTSTFALRPFAMIINALDFVRVNVVDPHNVEMTGKMIAKFNPIMPELGPLLSKLDAFPVYPDAGAAKRYKAKPGDLCCEKDREPLTGTIRGIIVNGKVFPSSYLIIDDICDGGRTFIEVAKKLYEAGAKEVHLYVSHGIFSKGLKVLRDAGIQRIFTYKGEVL